MIEQGRVIKFEDEFAEIVIDSKPECVNCNACVYFSPTKRKVIALNKVDAKPYDKVEVFVAPSSRVKASFLFYILPVMFFFGFYLIYSLYIYKLIENKPSELISAIVGIIGIFFSFIIVRLYQKITKPEQKNKSYIIRVL